MSYTDQDVEEVINAYFVSYNTSKNARGQTADASTVHRKAHEQGVRAARAALEAMGREPLVHGDLLDRLTRVAEAGFHWWEAWADEGGYDGEYKHMDREQRIDHILCHDLLLALDALAPDYFDGLTGKPKYAVAAAKGDE